MDYMEYIGKAEDMVLEAVAEARGRFPYGMNEEMRQKKGIRLRDIIHDAFLTDMKIRMIVGNAVDDVMKTVDDMEKEMYESLDKACIEKGGRSLYLVECSYVYDDVNHPECEEVGYATTYGEAMELIKTDRSTYRNEAEREYEEYEASGGNDPEYLETLYKEYVDSRNYGFRWFPAVDIEHRYGIRQIEREIERKDSRMLKEKMAGYGKGLWACLLPDMDIMTLEMKE